MTWWHAAPAILVAGAVVVGPGLIATAPLRAGLLARVALAGLVGVASTGVAAAVFGAAGLSFQPWQTLVVALLVAGVAFGVRRLAPHLVVSNVRLRALPVAGAWIAGAAAIALVAFWGVPDPDRISQTYDNVFHLSATAAILDGFSGSPFTLRSLIETEGGFAYYPAGWHLLAAQTAQLSGQSVAVAFNACWIAVAALVWLPGVAWLAQTVAPRRFAVPAATAALALGAAFGPFPYALLGWGTIYPTYLAHALLPAAVAVTVLAIRGVVAARRARGRAVVVASLGVLAAVGALGVAHPRVLPTWVIVGTPFVVAFIAQRVAVAWRRGGAHRRRAVRAVAIASGVVVAAFAAAFAYAVVGLGLFDEPLSDRLDGPQARAVQTVGEGLAQALLQQSMTGATGAITAAAPLLAVVVLGGVALAVRRGGMRWVAASFAVGVLLFALAAGSDGDIAKILTGTWYKDRYRLAAAIPVLAVPLAAVCIAWIGARLRHIRARSRSAWSAVAAVAVLATSAPILGATGMSEATASVFRMPDADAERQIVSQKQIDFMENEVRGIVPPDQRVLGDPWDGSALTQLFADREPVFPHVNGQWDPHRLALAWHLDDIDENPDVCAALDALRVRYVLFDPHEFGGGDPAGNHFPGPHAAVERGMFEQVATDGTTALFRIDQCGPLS